LGSGVFGSRRYELAIRKERMVEEARASSEVKWPGVARPADAGGESTLAEGRETAACLDISTLRKFFDARLLFS
jgi:hypothetical protein